MNDLAQKRKQRRDFEFTLTSVIAIAQSRKQLRQAQESFLPDSTERFEFIAQAADTGGPAKLPSHRFDSHRAVVVNIERRSGEVRLHLQLQQSALRERLMGGRGRLVTGDRRIDVTLRFDEQGEALVVLEDSEAVTEALGRQALQLDIIPESSDG